MLPRDRLFFKKQLRRPIVGRELRNPAQRASKYWDKRNRRRKTWQKR